MQLIDIEPTTASALAGERSLAVAAAPTLRILSSAEVRAAKAPYFKRAWEAQREIAKRRLGLGRGLQSTRGKSKGDRQRERELVHRRRLFVSRSCQPTVALAAAAAAAPMALVGDCCQAFFSFFVTSWCQ